MMLILAMGGRCPFIGLMTYTSTSLRCDDEAERDRMLTLAVEAKQPAWWQSKWHS